MNNIIIETERLYLRKLNECDMDDLSLLLQDEKVMYAYEHGFSKEEVISWYNKQIERYNKYGFGLWAVILKSTGKFIGQCGITYQEYKENLVYETGYLLKKEYWHKGYAIESAKACKDYAFNVLCADEVYAIIRTNNAPSIKVAIKNGMTLKDTIIKHYYNMDMTHNVYSITKDKYEKI